jgi:hypothetical protein
MEQYPKVIEWRGVRYEHSECHQAIAYPATVAVYVRPKQNGLEIIEFPLFYFNKSQSIVVLNEESRGWGLDIKPILTSFVPNH